MGSRFKFYWITRRGNLSYRLTQLKLDLMGWPEVHHHRRVKLFGLGRSYLLPFPGPHPACRRVVGPSGHGLSKFAMPVDCGKCKSCRSGFPLVTVGHG